MQFLDFGRNSWRLYWLSQTRSSMKLDRNFTKMLYNYYLPASLHTIFSSGLRPLSTISTYCCWKIALGWHRVGITWYLSTSRPSRHLFRPKLMAGWSLKIALSASLIVGQELWNTALMMGFSSQATIRSSLNMNCEVSMDCVMTTTMFKASDK